jgi:dolichol-phosphate mannosyltransferase
MIKNSNYLIIIPAYNEEETIKDVVFKAKRFADVCVVDDCSTDGTSNILRYIKGIQRITHKVNTHIPGAIIDGMKYAIEKGYDYVITMDAGLSHNPYEIPLFMDIDRSIDMVIGSRENKWNTPLYRKLLSKVGNFIYNLSLDFPYNINSTPLFKGKYYKDLTSGYCRFSKRAIEVLLSKEIRSKSFDFRLESINYVYKSGLSIGEVPITYYYSNSSLNKKVIWDCMKMSYRFIIEGLANANRLENTKRGTLGCSGD